MASENEQHVSYTEMLFEKEACFGRERFVKVWKVCANLKGWDRLVEKG